MRLHSVPGLKNLRKSHALGRGSDAPGGLAIGLQRGSQNGDHAISGLASAPQRRGVIAPVRGGGGVDDPGTVHRDVGLAALAQFDTVRRRDMEPD